jgi:hypothetical protein
MFAILHALGTLRPERLDQVPIFGEAHPPLGRAIQQYGTIAATPVLSGLHHRYAWI